MVKKTDIKMIMDKISRHEKQKAKLTERKKTINVTESYGRKLS